MRRREFLGILSSSLISPKLVASGFPKGRKKVAIFGGGVGGLTAAHELLERGFDVTIYEKNSATGGKARSIPVPYSNNGGGDPLPGEHGFRFFPGFYTHTFDTMARIPFGNSSVKDNLVPFHEILFSRKDHTDIKIPTHLPNGVGDLKKNLKAIFGVMSLGIPEHEIAFFLKRYWVFLTSCEQRRFQEFENISWKDFVKADATKSPEYHKYLANGLTKNLVAAKGDKASARTMGAISFQLIQGILHKDIGKSLVLNGPTSEVWIDPWMRLLTAMGLSVKWACEATGINLKSDQVSSVDISYYGLPWRVEADHYIFSVPPDILSNLLNKNLLKGDPNLGKVSNIFSDWMVGLQFYFDRDLKLGLGTQIYVDSPWALTAVSQTNFWRRPIDSYSDGSVKGILSVDISNWDEPGILYFKKAKDCSRKEIEAEVWAQLLTSVDDDVANEMRRAVVLNSHLDPAIKFRGSKAYRNDDRLFINTPGTWWNRPEAETKIPNLFLAADYVRTHTDLACMESANEAGRRAVNSILKTSDGNHRECLVQPLQEPRALAPEKTIDRARFKMGLPNVHDLF